MFLVAACGATFHLNFVWVHRMSRIDSNGNEEKLLSTPSQQRVEARICKKNMWWKVRDFIAHAQLFLVSHTHSIQTLDAHWNLPEIYVSLNEKWRRQHHEPNINLRSKFNNWCVKWLKFVVFFCFIFSLSFMLSAYHEPRMK